MSGFGYTAPKMANDEWLTPPEVIKACGEFDLDPCSPINRPWDMAKKHFTINDNGLLQNWEGRVWLNPPYGKEVWQWLDKLALHGNGIALIFARTDVAGFHDSVFRKASSVLFLKGRLTFYTTEGRKASFNGGAPSALVSYDANPKQPHNAGSLIIAEKILGGKLIFL